MKGFRLTYTTSVHTTRSSEAPELQTELYYNITVEQTVTICICDERSLRLCVVLKNPSERN